MTVYMPDTDYKAICDATREKCGTNGLLKSYEIKPLLAALETGGAKFTLTVNVDSGSTVVATKGSLSVSGTAAGGVCVLELPEAGEWTVTASLNGQSASGVVNVVGEYKAAAIYVDPTFANNSWETIVTACHSGSVPNTWAVGNQKSMTINGTNYTIDIIDKNHDAYADGSGYAPLTLQLHENYGTLYAMDSSNSNSVSWSNCEMRNTHFPQILSLMPAEVRAGIRLVNKLTSAGNMSSSIVITADKLFPLSEVETFGANTNSAAGEGSQYAYYAQGNSTVKNYQGSAKAYWGRSPAIASTTNYCYVRSGGGTNTTGANSTNCVAFAFCF